MGLLGALAGKGPSYPERGRTSPTPVRLSRGQGFASTAFHPSTQ